MLYKKFLPVLLFVSLLAAGIFQPSSANLTLKSVIKGFVQPSAVITVCANGCEFDNIQEAIDDQETKDGDTLALESETYTETLTIDKSLTLLGTGYFSTTIQAAGEPETAASSVIQVTDGITVVIDGITIRHGYSGSDGGGVLNQGTLTIQNSLVINNTANNGGGIANIPQSGLAKITITNTTIKENEALASGGGIYNYASDSGTIAETIVFTSTIVANGSDHDFSSGGGAANRAGDGTATLNISTSTFSSNIADSGGGVYIQSSITGIATSTLEHITFFGNSAEDGSNLYLDSGTTNIQRSILAYGQDSQDCYKDSGAILTDGGYNLVEDGSCGFPVGGDPYLGILFDNGGDTETHAILGSSPALDIIPPHLCSPAFDQRGVVRPYGPGCDSGAFESNTTELAFLPTVEDNNIKPGGLVTFTMNIELIGPGITGGIISADTPEELTIQEPIILDPPDSGETGTPPTLAHSIVISANQMFTLTMYTRVAEGLKAGTVLTETVSFNSNETPTPLVENIFLDVVNVPPIAVDDIGDDFLTNPFTTIFYTPSVLDNDIDLNGDTLEIIDGSINTENLLGEVTCDLESGICAYNPNGQFDDLVPGQTATDTFTYQISDGLSGIAGEDATGIVTITLRMNASTVYLPMVNK